MDMVNNETFCMEIQFTLNISFYLDNFSHIIQMFDVRCWGHIESCLDAAFQIYFMIYIHSAV